jgi:hypothetical protein
MKTRTPLSAERLDAVIGITPATRALETLIGLLPHVPTPGRRFNRTQELLNHVYAVDGSFGSFGMALFIDYGTGQEFDDILDALREIGAVATASYLEEGKIILGGLIPKDECERARLTELHDPSLRMLDLKFRAPVQGEAAAAFIDWLKRNRQKALSELNQTER